MNTPLLLKPNSVDIWLVYPQDIVASELLEHYAALLSDEERKRKDRFHFAKHRHFYLVTRALEKNLLSRYTGIAAADLRFDRNAYGKPQLRLAADAVPLHYNISHTDQLIMMACCRSGSIGIDLESPQRDVDHAAIAPLCFTPTEIKLIKKQTTTVTQTHQFFEFWTLKEALIKAVGKGMSIPLHSIAFDLTQAGCIDYRDENDKEHGQWRAFTFQADDDHLAAVCVPAKIEPTLNVTMRAIVPALSEADMPFEVMRVTDGLSILKREGV